MTRINSDNLFGLSDFIVDTSASKGSFTTIQAALNAASAAGGGTVYVRPGTYTENLILMPGVDIVGAVAESRDSSLPPANVVTILGTHTLTTTGSVGIDTCVLDGNGADIISVLAGAAAFSLLVLDSCALITAGPNMGTVGNLLGGFSVFVLLDCNATFSGAGFTMNGSCQLLVQDSDFQGGTGPGFINNQTAGQLQIERSSVQTTGAACVEMANATSGAQIRYNTFTSGANPIYNFSGAGLVAAVHNSYSSTNASGEYVIGAAGTYHYCDEIIDGSAFNIAATITSSPIFWRPTAESGIAPGTGVVRGTAAFDSAAFTVTDGFVQLVGGGSPITTLTANDASFTTGTNITLNGVDGITTVNAGAGTISIDNKRWLSAYTVDAMAVPGSNNAEYTTIQAAINAAAAAGGGTVYVRPGTYVENLTLAASVDVIGAISDMAPKTFNFSALPIIVNGNHTYSGSGTAAVENIFFIAVAGDTFSLTSAAGTANISFVNCTVDSAAARAVVLTSAGGTSTFIANNTYFLAATDVIDLSVSSSLTANDCFFYSTGGAGIINGGAAGGGVNVKNCQIQVTTAAMRISNAASSSTMYGNIVISTDGIDFAAAGTVQSYHNTWSCGAGSGNYVDGAAGTYIYADEVLIGPAQGIGAGITQSIATWRPFATSGNSGTAKKGTSAFDSTQFTVTDGFVQITSPTGITWSDEGAPTTVSSFSGSFATAAVTLTLPPAPSQGDICEFVAVTAGALVIQANGGQTIEIGSSASSVTGTATSTAIGDSIRLVYRSTGAVWWAVPAVEGIWTLA